MAEQISSIEGSSIPQVQRPDTSFSGDIKMIESFQSVLPKYAGENPYTFKKRLIQNDDSFEEFSEDLWQVSQPEQAKQIAQEDPEQYQALKNRYKKNLRKDLSSSMYAGEEEKDTLINRTADLRQTPQDIPTSTYRSLINKYPQKYEQFGIVEDKQSIYGDDRDDSIAFAQKVASNPELHRTLVGQRYAQFQDDLNNSFNNANLINDPAKKTQAWVIYDNFGSEGLTQYINGLQSEDLDQDITTRTRSRQESQQYFSQAKINDKTAFDLIEGFITGGDQPLTFQPVEPRDDLTVDVPSDSNAYTNLFYDVTDQKEFVDRDFNGVSEKFLQTFAPDNYKKFLDVKNIDNDGVYSQEYRDLTWSVYEGAMSTNVFGIGDLQNTVKQHGEYVSQDGEPPRYRIDYEAAPAKVKLAIDALRHDDESNYMFQFVEEGVFDFRPKRRETAQKNFDMVKNTLYATKNEMYEDENGELQAREVVDNSGLWGAWNAVATLGLGVADMGNRYFLEPAVRITGELTDIDGVEAFASKLKDYTGVNLATGLSKETDGIVPNAIGEVAPFLQYMGAMMLGGSAIVRGGAKAFSAITNLKRGMDIQRYAGKMIGSTRLQAMAKKLDIATKNKAPWTTGTGIFYTGGVAIEATQPKETSFLNTVPQLLGYDQTNDLTELYKTSSDATRVGMDVGASLMMDGFFDTLIAGSKFFTAKGAQKYFNRKEFKGIRYLEEGNPNRSAKFGGYEVVDEPLFRHDLREFWGNLTTGLDELPIGSVGETMAKGITKQTGHATLHDFTRAFIDDNDYVTRNIKGDIEDNVRYLNRTLGDGVEMADDDIAKIVDEQYGYFMETLSDEMYGVLKQGGDELPMKVAQTLDEQIPTISRATADNGRPLRPSEVGTYGSRNLIVKGNEVYEVEPNFWTIDLSRSLRERSLKETKESVVQRKIDRLGEDVTAEQTQQIIKRADDTIGMAVELDGKVGYVVDFDDAGYTVRTVDGDLKKAKVLSDLTDEQFEQQVRNATNNKVVRQKLMFPEQSGEIPQQPLRLGAGSKNQREGELLRQVDDIDNRISDLQRRYEVLDDVVDDGRLRGTQRSQITRELKELEAQKQDAQKELSRFLRDNPELLEARKSTYFNSEQLALKFEPAKKKSGIFDEGSEDIAVLEKAYKANKGIDVPEGQKIYDLDVENSKRIADEYDAMKHEPNNEQVKASYEALAAETMEQFKYLIDDGFKVEIYKGAGEPYKNSPEMLKDLRENKRLYVLSTKEEFGQKPITDAQRKENPLLRDSGFTDVNDEPLLINDVFRFVHDSFGHGKRGNSFGPKGEENAWDVHSRMYTPLARRAMTTETRGQNSWVNFGKQMRADDGSLKKIPLSEREFAEQKVGLMPEWVSKVRDDSFEGKVNKAYDDQKISKYNERINSTAKSIAKTVNKQLQLDFC